MASIKDGSYDRSLLALPGSGNTGRIWDLWDTAEVIGDYEPPVYGRGASSRITLTGDRITLVSTYPVEITVRDQRCTYNGTAYTRTITSDFNNYVTVSGLFSGDSLTSVKITGQGIDAGSYSLDASDAEFSIKSSDYRYRVTYTSGRLTIGRADCDVTITVRDQNYTYNGTSQGNPIGVITSSFDDYVIVSGLDELSDTVSLTSLDLTGGPKTEVGTYPDELKASHATFSSANYNYRVNYVPGKLTIDPAYRITYHKGDATSGEPPVDDHYYPFGGTAFILDRGTLEKDEFIFAGWTDTKPSDITGNDAAAVYKPGSSFKIKNNTTFYPVWADEGFEISASDNP